MLPVHCTMLSDNDILLAPLDRKNSGGTANQNPWEMDTGPCRLGARSPTAKPHNGERERGGYNESRFQKCSCGFKILYLFSPSFGYGPVTNHNTHHQNGPMHTPHQSLHESRFGCYVCVLRFFSSRIHWLTSIWLPPFLANFRKQTFLLAVCTT